MKKVAKKKTVKKSKKPNYLPCPKCKGRVVSVRNVLEYTELNSKGMITNKPSTYEKDDFGDCWQECLKCDWNDKYSDDDDFNDEDDE